LPLHVESLERRVLLTAVGAGSTVDLSQLAIDLDTYDSSKILVQLKAGSNVADVLVLSGTQFQSVTTFTGAGVYEVLLADDVSVAEALEAYGSSSLIQFAEPNYRISLTDITIPDDSLFGSMWGLQNTGQTGGTIDADIDAVEAWSLITGGPAPIVAVIDSGIDYTHPDLAANIWVNAGEIGGNGIDDDGNGYIDDYHGYDFVNLDGDPMDDNGHGTHVAGTIGAVRDNGLGVTGIAPNVQLMALKFLDDEGSGYTSNAVRALDYAVANGAIVSNNSWGGGGYSTALFNAISAARDAGHIVVAAAGNSGLNADITPQYPSGYDLDNVVSVAATDHHDQLASFSNYGAATVDLAAPGTSILSTTPGNSYSYYSGTSMATPHVAGAIALLASEHPDWTYSQIIDRVLTTVDPIGSLQGKTATGGRLNLAAAVNVSDGDIFGPRIVQSTPSDLVSGTVDSVRVTFNEPIDVATFIASDVVGTGPAGSIDVVDVLAVSGTNGQEFDVLIGEQSAFGPYSLTIGPGIQDVAGNPMDQDVDGNLGEAVGDIYSADFTITPLRIEQSVDVPKSILDQQTARSYLTITDDWIIDDLDLKLDIVHTWVADLTISLVSPTGTTVLLSASHGGDGNNYTDTRFDDEASDTISSGAAPFSGSFRPDQPLSVFDGQSTQGTWELRIEDGYNFDQGTLNNWMLILEAAPPNIPPSIDIPDQSMSHLQDTLVIDLPATDAEGEPVTYTAQFVTADPLGHLAYETDQQLGLYLNGSYGEDWAGLGEKWMQSSSQTPYYITPAGQLYRWGGSVGESTLVATFDSSFHADPTKLHDALPPLALVDVGASTVDIVDHQLIVDPTSEFLGDLYVDVLATDLKDTVSKTIKISVTNFAPVLSISDQTISHMQDTLTLTLPAADADGEAVTYTASIDAGDPLASLAYQIDQQLGLYLNGSYGEDWAGLGEKWMQSASQTPYYIVPSGQLYRWEGSTDDSVLVATFDSSYHADPTLLHDAQTPVAGSSGDSAVTVTGNDILIDPQTGFTGSLSISVTATDGLTSIDQTFLVNVTNSAPALAVSDQVISHTQDMLTLTLPAADADGETVTYSASFAAGDALASLAYQIDQQFGLYLNGSYGEDWAGLGEKWMQSAGQTPYYIVPSGQLYSWGGSVDDSTLVASFDSSYFANPTLLHEAQSPAVGDAGSSTIAVVGNQITIDPEAGFTGGLDVSITASDGMLSVTGMLTVTVINTIPVLSLADLTIPIEQDTVSVSLAAVDDDGDALVYTASIAGGDPLSMLAFQIDQELGLYLNGSYGEDWAGLGEKWMQSGSQTPYYIVPSGQLYRWQGSVDDSALVATFDSTYHADPTLLHEAQAPLVGDAGGSTVSIVGDELIIDPAAGFTGMLMVDVSVTDGAATIHDSFTLTVEDADADLATHATQDFRRGDPTLAASDDDQLRLLDDLYTQLPGDARLARPILDSSKVTALTGLKSGNNIFAVLNSFWR